MRRLMYPPGLNLSASLGLLLLRLVVGTAFLLHGWLKIRDPMHWMGNAMPGVLQLAAVVSEVGGGIALILGLLTRPFSLSLMVTMFVAVFMVHMAQGHRFVSREGPTYELAATYLACTTLLFLMGPGWLSLDAVVFGKRRG